MKYIMVSLIATSKLHTTKVLPLISQCNNTELAILSFKVASNYYFESSAATLRQHGHYIPCQDDRIQQGPNLSARVYEAHDLS